MRGTTRRRAIAAGAVAAVALGATGIASMSASASDGDSAAKGKTAKIKMRADCQEEGPLLQRSEAGRSGTELKIVNKTDPNKVGPHTFTLIKQNRLPDTSKEVKACENLELAVCVNAFKAHEVEPDDVRGGQAQVDVGRKGWDKSFGKTGDSWFTADRRASRSRGRSRPTTARPSTTSAWSTPSCRARSRSSSRDRVLTGGREDGDGTRREPTLPAGTRLSRRRLLLTAAGGAAALAAPTPLLRGGPARSVAASASAPLPVPVGAADPPGPHRRRHRPADRRGGDPGPAGPADEDVDVRRRLSGADDPPPDRRDDPGHLPAPAPEGGGRADGPPPRRPQQLR